MNTLLNRLLAKKVEYFVVIDHYSEGRIYTVKRTMSESLLELTGHMPTDDLILNHEHESVHMTIIIVYFHFFIKNTIGQKEADTFVKGRRGHDRMVVGFTTTYEISAYHH